MTISVFTPSHNPKWLNETYESLITQSYEDWEWVVLLNNGAEWEAPKPDERVKIVQSKVETKAVGALKAEAVSLCSGEILLELDHDDLLMPTTLEKVAKAFAENPEVGFVYSDFAQINEDGTPNFNEFDSRFGWSYRDEDGYHITNSKSPHPHHISLIWFAPNHLRAFTRKAYDSANGYNPGLEILDDQDLMCRLYLQTKFHHIKENLYLQRIHANQTQADPQINPKIQAGTLELYNIYISDLLLKWAGDNHLRALDLGGAHNPKPGFQTVDLHDADIVGDIFDVLASMPDNSVGVIRAADFLEHIPDKIGLWNEMYRVLADGGMVLSITPSTDGRGAFQDPTHNSFYNENSFWYFIDENFRRFVPELKMDFQTSRLLTYFPSEFHQKHNISYVLANLIAVKGEERFGGWRGAQV